MESFQYPHGNLLWLAYDGSLFHGMAAQANARTVAGELHGALQALDPRVSPLRILSRTDTGVHARAQVAAFDSYRDISPRGWVLGVGPHLPTEIAVVGASVVPPGFDPRGYVRSKTYRYRILESDVRDPFLSRRAWRIVERLNHELLCAELATIVGTHDFAAFRGATDERTQTVRTIFSATWTVDAADPRCHYVEVSGDGFLYRMVRIIVGTAIDVARGRIAPGAMARGLASLSRPTLGMTAPPDGLALHEVELTEVGTSHWPYR